MRIRHECGQRAYAYAKLRANEIKKTKKPAALLWQALDEKKGRCPGEFSIKSWGYERWILHSLNEKRET
jgi:hypothetical protein